MQKAEEEHSLDNLLKSIDSPDDLKRLSPEQLPQVCSELRQMIIDELSHNPGHFGSSLGTVELTVALHYVFNTPDDRIVWDVGHQAYGHKILTGRRDRFCTNRKFGGLRPFPSPDESPYDTFTAGHASNSISAALGMAVADKRNGNASRRVVAVIGDGAMSGGLAFEGINNASITDNDLLIILNDNNMSISQSVGGMRSYLTQLQTSRSYNKFRYYVSRALDKLGLMTEQRRRDIIRRNNRIKIKLTHQNNMFEGMDIRYFGPVDGHNVQNLVRILSNIKNMHGPKLLHIKTIKGKGYEPAEKDSAIWHAPGLFDKVTGERIVRNGEGQPPLFQDVFGETLLDISFTRSSPLPSGRFTSKTTSAGFERNICSLALFKSSQPNIFLVSSFSALQRPFKRSVSSSTITIWIVFIAFPFRSKIEVILQFISHRALRAMPREYDGFFW